MTEDVIADPTEEAPNVSGSMVVIHRKLPGSTVGSLTDVADAALSLIERLVLLLGDSIRLLYSSGVCGLSEGLLACPVVSGASWPRMGSFAAPLRRTVLTLPHWH